MSNQAKQILWNERIDSFLASGLSQRAWCQEQGLPPQQLSYWLRKHHRKEGHPGTSRWVSIDAISTSSGSGVSLRVGTITLDVEPGFDQQVLADVLRSLMSVC